jgi:hypothetical protein
MQALLTVIVTWLSINFGLPATYEHPRVELASPAQMAAVRHSRLAAMGRDRVAPEGERLAQREISEEVFAIYDDATRTIYLHRNWTGTTPADSSLLVHELVHHLQNVAAMKFDCAGEREKAAYRAQRAWLELFGRTLEQEFEIDPMTVLIRTNCPL